MADNIVEVVLKINASQFKNGIENATKVYAQSTKNLTSASGQAGGGVQKLTGTVLRLGAAYVSVSQSIRLVRTLLDTAGNFEQLRVQLETLSGSAEAGEAAFEWVKEFTANTPFGLNEVTRGFIKLKAFGLDPLDGTFQAIADQAAALGGGQEKLNGIILAVGQGWAKQKLQGEEILQLVERGVPVWDLLAKATGKNTIELQKLSEQGKLGRDVIRALLEEMGKGVDGAALANMDTWNGIVSNAVDQWSLFLDEIGQSGVMEDFKAELKSLLEEIQRLRDSGELKQYAAEVGEAIITLKDVLGGATNLVHEFSGEIGLLIKLSIASKLANAAAGMTLFQTATEKAAASTKALTATIRARNIALTLGAVLLIEGGITAVKGYSDRQKANRKLAKAEKDYAEAVVARNKKIAENEADALLAQLTIRQRMKNALKDRAAFQEQFAEKIKKAKKAETQAVEQALTRQQELYENHLKSLQATQKKQQNIAREFADFVNEIGGGGKKTIEDPDLGDFSSAITKARKLLNADDFDGAIEGARGLADMIRKMQENGTEADVVLKGLARKAEDLANDAAAKRVEGEQAKLEKAKAAIESLAKKAEFLKLIEIGFNDELAVANAAQLREKIRQVLAKTPIVIPVSYGVPGAPAQGINPENALNNTPALPDNSTPIRRSVELDTSLAEKQLDDLQKKAEQPAVKPVKTIYSEGNSFSDSANSFGEGDVRLEALARGKRR